MASISGNWRVHNFGVQFLLNGVARPSVSLPIAFNNLPVNNVYPGAPLFGFSVSDGVVAGINTLDFVVQNVDGTGVGR